MRAGGRRGRSVSVAPMESKTSKSFTSANLLVATPLINTVNQFQLLPMHGIRFPPKIREMPPFSRQACLSIGIERDTLRSLSSSRRGGGGEDGRVARTRIDIKMCN